MQTRTGAMATDRPERYAKQLASHWARRGPATDEDGATVLRWETGQVIVLRPVEGALEVEARCPTTRRPTGSPRWSRSTSSGSGSQTS